MIPEVAYLPRKINYEKVSHMALVGMKTKDVNIKFYRSSNQQIIIDAVCDLAEMTFEDMKRRTRRRSVLIYRQTCMFLLRRYTNLTLMSIAKIFECDHTTVINAVRVVKDLMETDDYFRRSVQSLEIKIQ